LLGIIAAMVSYALSFHLDININTVTPNPKSLAETQETKTEPAQANPISEYSLVAEQNLFHPERKIPPEKKDEQLPKPEFALYGTLITGETKIAYLEDLKAPHTTAGRGKRQKSLKLGQTLSGYTLKEVHHDRILMAKAEDVIEVKIDAKRSRTKETAGTATQPAPTVSSTKEKPGGGAPPGVVHSGPPPAGAPIPDEKTISRVKDALGPGIIKKPGVQQQLDKPR
jgi:hypothetical protein